MTDSAEDILAAALAIPDPDQREAFVERACAGQPQIQRWVLQLLTDRDESRPTVPAPAAPQPATLAEAGTDQVGPFRLVQKLGEGGMGVVFLAEQDQPVRRRVALKIVKPGMDSGPILARFESERQALALMDHPGIARVLDAGTTEVGRPYFVMELVDGVAITRFAEQHALGLRPRLELFAEVCLAIQHAHQKGVIHRDIKPSNVLVTVIDGKPVPKVIDFGLAKALHLTAEERGYQTQFGAVVGTPEYMAPEQAALAGIDADTRGDVYSLGVLLYQLLTGTTPVSREDSGSTGMMELLRHVVLDEPEKPSARLGRAGRTKLARQVRGELDWIAMKALEKDRARRYQTAFGLATDVRRYLAGEPVEAGPPSAWYRLSKFAARHRAALLTAAAVAVLLICSTAVSVRLAVYADQERRLADEVLEYLRADVLGQPGPDLQARPWAPVNPDRTVRESLRLAGDRLHGRFPGQPRLEVALRNTIGNALREMGEAEDAERQLDQALRLARERLGPEHPDTARTMYNLSWVYGRQGRYADLEALSEELVPLAQKVFGRRDKVTLASQRGLGWVLLMQGRYERSEGMLEPTLAALRQVCGPSSEETLDCLDTLATCRRYRGKYAEADALLEEATSVGEGLGEDGRMYLCSTRLEQALLRACQGRFAEADDLSRAVVAELRDRLTELHPEARQAARERAWVLLRAGKDHEAVGLLRGLVEVATEKVRGEAPARSAAIWQLYAQTLLKAGEYSAAEVRLRVVRRVYDEVYPDHWMLDRALSDLGASLLGQNKFDAAEPLLRGGHDGLSRRKATLPAFEVDCLRLARERLAQLYQAWGKPDEARRWQSDAGR
ncbi:MAG: serine/threonine-protein kinase [Gemmataceae bacterium]